MRAHPASLGGLTGLIMAAVALFPASSAAQVPGTIRYGTNLAVSIPDQSSRVSSISVNGVGSPILDVRVLVHITHPATAELDISLTGPDGTRVDLSSDNGGTAANYGTACTPDGSMTMFDDGATVGIELGRAPFVGAFRPEEPLSAFDGKTGAGAANGTWQLQVGDDTAGNVGTLRCWYLLITAAVTSPISVDDTYTTRMNTPLVVPAPGVLANDDTNGGGAMTAAILSNPSHGSLAFSGNGGFTYTPQTGYVGTDVFAYQATNGVGPGNVARVDLTVTVPPPTAVDDAFTTTFQTPLVVAAPGVLGNDVNPDPTASMSAGLVGLPTNGTVVLGADGGFTYTPGAGFVGADSFVYRATSSGGASNSATVRLTVSPPTNAQPPTNLFVYTVTGNLVTLRWTPPVLGPAATQYVLEGGIRPQEVLASIPTGSSAPVFTFVAPTGSFYIRLHTLSGADKSLPSNEVRLHVNVPVVPSAPAVLSSLVNGRTLNLSWRKTFTGGEPTRMVLGVTGTYTGSFTLEPSDTFGFAGVPDGTYTLRVFAANDGGVSLPSPAVTVTFPGPCSGAPLSPSGFLAYRLGRTIFVIWDPAPTGPAATGFVLIVSGAYTGNLPTTTRALSGTVGPGQYDLRVVATNACGVSAPTAVQTVVVP